MRRTPPLIAVGLAGAVVAVFAQVRGHAFVQFDDFVYVVDNPLVRGGFGLHTVRAAFASAHAAYWIPLTWLSLATDHALYGLAPAGYLLTNVALHALSTLLLFAALVRMTGATWRAAFVAAVFAVHPLHVESVAWVTERKDCLSALFFMLALNAHAHHARAPGSPGRYALVLVCLVVGLLAKPNLVTLPCVLLLLDAWPLGRLRVQPRRVIVEKLPMFAVAAAASVATFVNQRAGGGMEFAGVLSFGERALLALEGYGHYIAKSIWPSRLAAIHPYPLEPPSAWRGVLSGLVLLAVTVAVVRHARRHPYAAVGWLWFLGMLFPVSGLVQVGVQTVADRFMHLPLIGLSMMVAWGAPALAGRLYTDDANASSSRLRLAHALLAVAAALGVAALGVAAWRQTAHWRDTRSLFERAVAVIEDNYYAHHRLAEEHRGRGRLDEAEPHWVRAMQIAPQWEAPQQQLAALLELRGDAHAAAVIRGALRPTRWTDRAAHARVGLTLVRARRFADAVPLLAKALARQPASAELHGELAVALAKTGRPRDAVRHGREALRLDPRAHMSANNLAWVLATTPDVSVRDPEEAVRVAESALGHMDAPLPPLLDALAAAHAARGAFDEAVRIGGDAARLADARGETAMAALIRTRLEHYRAGRPYVDSLTGE